MFVKFIKKYHVIRGMIFLVLFVGVSSVLMVGKPITPDSDSSGTIMLIGVIAVILSLTVFYISPKYLEHKDE